METIIEKLKEKILTEGLDREISVDLDVTDSCLLIISYSSYYRLSSGEVNIHLNCFWRAIHDSKVLFTSEDDMQLFGLKEPFSINDAYGNFFASRRVVGLKIKSPIADLQIFFDDGSYIEALATSGGYESWSISGKDIEIICLGEGKLGFF